MNPLRAVFAGMAGVGCAWIGARMARTLSRREETLAAWLRALESLEASISYVDDPLPDILERIGSTETPADARLRDMLTSAARRMRGNRSLTFERALCTDWADGLTQSDAAALSPLIRSLGASARAQQIGRIQSAHAALRAQSERAAEQTAKCARLYRSLGSLGGLALFLCLIG